MIATLEAPPSDSAPSVVDVDARVNELVETISASRLNLWNSCRLKFWFRYVDQIRKPVAPVLHVGSVVHSVLQAWNLARWRREDTGTDAMRAVFEESWVTLNADKPIAWEEDEEVTQKTAAWLLVETYLRDSPIPKDERPEAVEVRVESDMRQMGLPKLVGVIDLVRSGGRIVDFKTTAQTPTSSRAAFLNEIQASCYAMLYRESTGRIEGGIEIHHLVKLKTPKIVVVPLGPMTELQETRLLRLIRNHVDGLTRRDIVPSRGFHCSGCEFFDECRNWG
jgi:CRISPR/Cas system-associated exonuclease Cas4 (RecB family)